MSDPTKATTYNAWADIGDGKLYLMQIFPTLIEAQTFARVTLSQDNAMYMTGETSVPVVEIVIVRTYMEEVERVDADAAGEWARTQHVMEANENVLAFDA